MLPLRRKLMLPVSAFKYGHFADGIPTSIAWLPDRPSLTLIVGQVGQKSLCAAFSSEERWTAEASQVDTHALYIDDFELLVDERSAVRFDNLDADARVGCLVAAGEEMRLCAPPPHSGRGYLWLPLQYSTLQLPPGFMLAFPKWKAVKQVGDAEYLLFERT